MENKIQEILPYLIYGENSLVKLFDLQAIAVEKLNINKCLFIFDETGAGKTISAGHCILDTVVRKREEKVNILIICPNTLTSNWYNKVVQKYGVEFKIWGGRKEDIKHFGRNESNLIITSYNANKDEKESNRGLNVLIDKLQKESDYENEIFKWDLIILDESHNTKAKNTFYYLNQLRAKKIIFLSATPITNKFDELEQQIKLANEILDEKEEISANGIKNNPLNLIEKIDINSPFMRNFKEIILNSSVRNRKIENINYEIEKVYAEKFLEKYRNCYGDIVHDFEYFQNCCNLNIFFKELQKIDNKLESFLKKIKDLTEGESKTIVFCRRKDTVEYLRKSIVERYPKLKVKAITSESFISVDERKKFLLLSNNIRSSNSEYKVLITIDTLLSEGYDMTTFDSIINYELPFTPAQIEQRFGRIDRLIGYNHKEISMYNFKNTNYTEEFDCAYSDILERKSQNEVLTCIPSKSTLTIKEIKKIIILKEIEYIGFSYLKEKIENAVSFSEIINLFNEHIDYIKIMIKYPLNNEEIKKIIKSYIESKYSFNEKYDKNVKININTIVSNIENKLKNICGINEEVEISKENINLLTMRKIHELEQKKVSEEMSGNIIWVDPKEGLTFKALHEIEQAIQEQMNNIEKFIKIGDLTLKEIINLINEFDCKFDNEINNMDNVLLSIWNSIKKYNYTYISLITYSLWQKYYSSKINYKNFIGKLNEVICNE